MFMMVIVFLRSPQKAPKYVDGAATLFFLTLNPCLIHLDLPGTVIVSTKVGAM